MRPDMLDVEYCEELTKLRTDVLPMNIDEVYDVIESSLGKSMKEVFSYFDEKPIGSASIAQAHRATSVSYTHLDVYKRQVMGREYVKLGQKYDLHSCVLAAEKMFF